MNALSIIALVALTTMVAGQSACQTAYTECDFRFRGSANRVPTFTLGVPNEPFTPRIFSVAENERLGLLNGNIRVESIIPDGRVFLVDDFGEQNFSPSAIKPIHIVGTPSSGLTREDFHGNQMMLARGACVRVFFRQYQILFPKGRRVMRNRNFVGRRENKCVVFMVSQ